MLPVRCRPKSLRRLVHLTQLPNGHFGMFVLSYFPPRWFRTMDPRLLARAQVDGDLDRVTVDPRRREALYERHGRQPPVSRLAG